MKNTITTLLLTSLFFVSNTALAQGFPSSESGASLSGGIESEEIASLPVVPSLDDSIIGIGAASPIQDMKLSDEQLEKIHSIKNAFKDGAAKKAADLQSLQRQLRDAIMQPKVDRSKVTDLQNQINALKGDLSTARLTMKLDSLDVLSVDQKAQLRHKALERDAFGGGRGGHGGRGCGGKRMSHKRGGAGGKQAQS